MSFILDALKRAEQQRGAPARGAASLPRAIATDFEPRARWPWIVGGAVSLAAVAAVVAFWPAREAAPPVATPEATVAMPARPPVPAALSTPPPVAVAPPRAEPAPPVPPARRERVVSAPPAPRVVEPRPPVSRPSPVVDRPAPRPAPRVQERAITPPPADVARATPPRPTSPEAAPPAAPSGDLKARAAKLSIQVLSWAPERKDRFVFLNGRKYGEGQMVEDQFLVEQITEDSVVLSAQGERITLKGR